MLEELNPGAVSLYDYYEPGLHRRESYNRMKDTLLAEVRSGHTVCAAFYGHPGIFVTPSHEAVREARLEGYVAQMLPAVSAQDCLFADLGVDPGATGCQSFSATDFLLRRRQVDPTAALILWQVSVVGIQHHVTESVPGNLGVLVDYLLEWYEPSHRVTLYEASPYPLAGPSITDLSLVQLPEADPTPLATLYVPPNAARAEDPEMAARLGVEL